MAILAMTQGEGEQQAGEWKYTDDYLIWKGFVEKVPILESILFASADATVASWKTEGSNDKVMADTLDEFTGNGKQTFKQIMRNMCVVAATGGNAYAEIIMDGSKLGNIIQLPSEDVQVVIENGRLKGYEQASTGEKFDAEEIFHLAYNPIGAVPYGRGIVRGMNNVLTHYLQILDTGSRIYESYIKPLEIFEVDTDDPTELTAWAERIKAVNKSVKARLIIPKDKVLYRRASVPEFSVLNPKDWYRVLMDIMVMSTRVPELALGTGSVNSEESAKVQFMGFRQKVRFDQKWLEDSVRLQLFKRQFRKDAPRIRFSYGTEAQDERFNRFMQAFSTINGSNLDDGLKGALMVKTLTEMGLIQQ